MDEKLGLVDFEMTRIGSIGFILVESVEGSLNESAGHY